MTAGTSYSPPPTFGRFRLLHQIGAGVLGPVFRTHDPDEDRLVAVKAFTIDLTPEQSEHLAEAFTQLAAAGVPLVHVATPLSAGVVDTVAYLAQLYVSGESLDAALRQYGPAPPPDAARLVSHVAGALDAAARVGVLHGALHPRDILVTPGETHMTGLGVAMALERLGARAPVRRPYAAPEREAGGAWGAPADVFALAAIAHEVLTGRRALPGTEEPLPGLDDLKVVETGALRELLESALDHDPGRRPVALEFATAFATSLGLSGAVTPPGGQRPRRRSRVRAVPKLPGLDEPLTVAPPAAAVSVDAAAAMAAIEPADEGLAVGAAGDAVAEDSSAEAHTDTSAVGGTMDVKDDAEPSVDAAPTADLDPLDLPAKATRATGATGRQPETLDLDGLERALDSGTLDTPAAPELDFDLPPIEPGLVVGQDWKELDAAPGATAAGGIGGGDPSAVLGLDPAEALAREPAAAGDSPDLADLLLSLPPPERAPTSPAGAVDLLGFSDAVAAPPVVVREGIRPREGSPVVERPAAVSRHAAPSTDVPTRPVHPAADEPRLTVDQVPRALDPATAARGGSTTRRVEPYRPLPPKPRPVTMPVALGVAVGLLVGVAGGYWWGSRQVAPAPAAAAVPSAPPVTEPVPATPPTETQTADASLPPGAASAPAPVPADATPKPAPPAEAPRAKAEVTTGSISVRSTPSKSNVFLGGKARGVTPRSLAKLPLGTYTVRVSRSGYQAQEKSVTITAEQPNPRLSFTLTRPPRPAAPKPAPLPPKPSGAPAAAPAPTPSPLEQAAQAAQAARAASGAGAIEIDTRPTGAKVRLDGADVGTSPVVLEGVKEGSHTVRLELEGFRIWTTTVSVKAGTRTRIAASLERSSTR